MDQRLLQGLNQAVAGIAGLVFGKRQRISPDEIDPPEEIQDLLLHFGDDPPRSRANVCRERAAECRAHAVFEEEPSRRKALNALAERWERLSMEMDAA